jgi:Cysteine rich repeat
MKGVAFMESRSMGSGIQPGWLAVVCGIFCLALSSVTLAQEARPCAEDAAKLCKGVQPGAGRIAQCMKEHANELSPACKENMREMRERARNFAKACRQDIRQSCGNVQRGGGRIVQCLRQHEDALSPKCREHMPQARGNR